jgi:hypothetical protein
MWLPFSNIRHELGAAVKRGSKHPEAMGKAHFKRMDYGVKVRALRNNVQVKRIEDYSPIELAIVPIIQDDVKPPSGLGRKFSVIQFEQRLERFLTPNVIQDRKQMIPIDVGLGGMGQA